MHLLDHLCPRCTFVRVIHIIVSVHNLITLQLGSTLFGKTYFMFKYINKEHFRQFQFCHVTNYTSRCPRQIYINGSVRYICCLMVAWCSRPNILSKKSLLISHSRDDKTIHLYKEKHHSSVESVAVVLSMIRSS